MAKTAMKIKQQRKPKFSTRAYSRCKICGRPHAYLRKYGICRICFRELAYKGQIPGVKKASWWPKALDEVFSSLVRGRSLRLARYSTSLAKRTSQFTWRGIFESSARSFSEIGDALKTWWGIFESGVKAVLWAKRKEHTHEPSEENILSEHR